MSLLSSSWTGATQAYAQSTHKFTHTSTHESIHISTHNSNHSCVHKSTYKSTHTDKAICAKQPAMMSAVQVCQPSVQLCSEINISYIRYCKCISMHTVGQVLCCVILSTPAQGMPEQRRQSKLDCVEHRAGSMTLSQCRKVDRLGMLGMQIGRQQVQQDNAPGPVVVWWCIVLLHLLPANLHSKHAQPIMHSLCFASPALRASYCLRRGQG